MKASIDRIPLPRTEFRVRRGNNPYLSDFETGREKQEEDRRRILGLRKQIDPDARRSRDRRIGRLVSQISLSARRQSRSLASATYMRDLRERVTGQIWALVARTGNLHPRTLTLFPRGWEVPAGQLHRFNPVKRLAAVRQLLIRCGARHANGYLLAFIHGEFEPRRQVFQLHLHILAAGNFVVILDKNVRKSPTAKSIRGEYGKTDFVRQRLRIDCRMTNLPRSLTYLLKSYWPSRWQGVNASGKFGRSRRASRIPEPHHTEVLQWFDRWNLNDISLLMNLSVDRNGFRLADRAYTNGEGL